MEEKKKKKNGTRPTWSQVRELESRLSSQIEGTSRLVSECDGWREKYRESVVKAKECEMYKKKYEGLKTEFDLMEGEYAELAEERNRLVKEVEDLKSAKNRKGFFKKLFCR